MRISEIAAVLQKAAVDMQAFAANNDDFNFPDEVVLPFVMNFLTDKELRKFPTEPATQSSPAESSLH
jgi:hypothetical protein